MRPFAASDAQTEGEVNAQYYLSADIKAET